jgi:sugar phosphate isomerase/epimerase
MTAESTENTPMSPRSCFDGVQIGVITYSYRSMPCTAQDILNYAVQGGINSIELMGNTIEEYAGAPDAEEDDGAALLTWRTSVSMAPFEELRKMFNDAGVTIHIAKFGDIGNPDTPDAQIEYYFQAAKALGVRGITRELSEEAAERVGPHADEHGIVVAFHNHTQITPTTYDGPILSHGRHLGINLDIGHYVAGTNCSPIPIIEKFQDRILSVHLKDRKVNDGPNMPFGEGDTPVSLTLQYLKQSGLTFPADIELEYPVPDDSDAVREVARCVRFCKEALA